MSFNQYLSEVPEWNLLSLESDRTLEEIQKMTEDQSVQLYPKFLSGKARLGYRQLGFAIQKQEEEDRHILNLSGKVGPEIMRNMYELDSLEEYIREYLESAPTQLAKMQVIRLDQTRYSDDSLDELAILLKIKEICPNLEEVDLSNNCLYWESWTLVRNLIASGLTVNISGNPMVDPYYRKSLISLDLTRLIWVSNRNDYRNWKQVFRLNPEQIKTVLTTHITYYGLD